MDLDYAEEHTLREAIREGSVVASVCMSGQEDDEGCAHRDLYEGMAARGLLKLSRMWGSRFSPDGGEYMEFQATETAAALLDDRDTLTAVETRLEVALDALTDLTEQVLISDARDSKGHAIRKLAAAQRARRVLAKLAPAAPAKAPVARHSGSRKA